MIKAIAEGKSIFLVEGEKDVDTLMLQGLVATTTGNSIEWEPDYAQVLAGANLVLLHDYDTAGMNRRNLIIRKLSPHVRAKTLQLRVVEPPGLIDEPSHGKDITDWLGMGNTIEQLMIAVEQGPYFVLEESNAEVLSSGLRALCYDEFMLQERMQGDSRYI